MNSKRLNPNNQDYHVISSLIQHYNPTTKKLLPSDSEIPEPELCPQPHNLSVNKNYLIVPNSNTPDHSFRSLSSRNEHTRREHKKSADYSKRSNSPYTSPRTVFQDVEKILIIEQQLKLEKEKYRKLEKNIKSS